MKLGKHVGKQSRGLQYHGLERDGLRAVTNTGPKEAR